MILDYQLINRNPEGNVTGINISAIKYWIYNRIPYHADLHSYLEIHVTAREQLFTELAEQLRSAEIILLQNQIKAAVIYLEQLVDIILEHDETTYECDLRNHPPGEICPNRIGVVLPNPRSR